MNLLQEAMAQQGLRKNKKDLVKAIAIALSAHGEELDRSGKPVVLHPLAVMTALSEAGIEAQIVGVLHDTVEDTWVTLGYLREEGFSDKVVNAVDAVTRRDDESYEDFVLRSGQDPIGRLVKIADLRHNLTRGHAPTILKNWEKYHKALRTLGATPRPLE